MKIFDYVFGNRGSKDKWKRSIAKIEGKALMRAINGMEYEERKTRERIAKKKAKVKGDK